MKITEIKNFYQKYRYRIFFILSCLLGLTPLLWFDGRMITGEEFYALDYRKWGGLFAQGWSSVVNFGESSMLIPFKFQYLFFQLLHVLGVTNYVALVLWHVVLWVAAAAGLYFLLYKIYGQKHSEIIYFLAAALYTFNPYFLNVSPFMAPPRLVFTMLPYLFLLFYLYTQKKIGILTFILLSNLLILIFSSVFVNLPAGVAILVLLGLYITYQELLVSKNFVGFIKHASLTAILFLLLNLFWLVPTLIQTKSSMGEIRSTTSVFTFIGNSRLSDILSLFGSWAFREKIYNTELYYYPYFSIYDNFPGAILKYLPFVILILALIKLIEDRKRRDEKILLFSALTVLIYLLLSKGSSGPGGGIFEFAFKNLPMFWIFREPYAKFMPVLTICYAILLPLGFEFLDSAISQTGKKKVYKNTLIFALTLTSIYFAYPFITGKVVWDLNNDTIRSHKVVIPENYKKLNDLESSGYFIQFPSSGFKSYFKWESGYVGNPYILLSKMKMLNPDSGYSTNEALQSITKYLYINLFNDPKRFVAEADRYNINGIVTQKDLLNTGYPDYYAQLGVSYADYKNISNENFDLYKFPSPQMIDVYENPTIYNMSPSSLKLYNYTKDIINKDSFISFTEDNPDAFHASLQYAPDGKSAEAKLNNSTNFSYFVYDPHGTVTSLKLDGVESKFKEYGIVKKFPGTVPDCCSRLDLQLKELVPEKKQFPLKFIKANKVLLHKGAEHNSPELTFDNVDVSYAILLEDFDINSNYMFELVSASNVKTVAQFSMVEFDIQRESSHFLLTENFGTDKPQVVLRFSNIPPTYKKITDKLQHYLVISVPSNLEIKSPFSVIVRSIGQFKLNMPFVTAVRNSEGTPVKVSAEQHSVSDSLYTLKVPTTKESLIHFKQSYNQNWRLLEITEDQYNKVSPVMLYLKSLTTGAKPMNIEVYSNGWKVPESSNTRYYAIVFPFNFYAGIVFVTTSLAALLAAGIVIIRRKWRY